MESIIHNLYVGDDAAYAHVAGKRDWSVLRCCKEGPGGHRDTLGYSARPAPDGKHYLFADQVRRRALNFIDAHDPNFVPREMVVKGLEYIDARLAAGDKVLVACNQGGSRGPVTAMLYMRAIGELPYHFVKAEHVFHTLYPNYDPGIGLRTVAKNNWSNFDNLLRK